MIVSAWIKGMLVLSVSIRRRLKTFSKIFCFFCSTIFSLEVLISNRSWEGSFLTFFFVSFTTAFCFYTNNLFSYLIGLIGLYIYIVLVRLLFMYYCALIFFLFFYKGIILSKERAWLKVYVDENVSVYILNSLSTYRLATLKFWLIFKWDGVVTCENSTDDLGVLDLLLDFVDGATSFSLELALAILFLC